MKIALFSLFNSFYSGGRIHAWFMVEALAAMGHNVTVFTNQYPIFFNDFDYLPGHEQIAVRLLDGFRTAGLDETYDVVVLVPDLSGDLRYYVNLLVFIAKMDAKVVLLNFETSNWKRALCTYGYGSYHENGIRAVAPHCDLIISSTHISREFATQYFGAYAKHALHEVCYPPIHAHVVDRLGKIMRRDRIVVLSRLYPRHKNSHLLLQLVCPEMQGYEVVLIDGMDRKDPATCTYLSAACRRIGARFIYRSKLNERQKFELMKSARLTIFPSTFEGFGLPPVESLYCGTPCVCFDLDVLIEVNGDAPVYARLGDFGDMRSKIQMVLRAPDEFARPLHTLRYRGDFDRFSAKLHAVFERLTGK